MTKNGSGSDSLRLSVNFLLKSLSPVAILLSLALVSCSSSIKSESNTSPNRSDNKNSQYKSATAEEIKLYRQIGINYVCISRQAEIEFPKAIAIASTNFAAIIDRKHGGQIDEVGNDKLTTDQIYRGSYFQLIEGAIRACPDMVPDKEKSKFEQVIKKMQEINN